jgi:hypothetical protein
MARQVQQAQQAQQERGGLNTKMGHGIAGSTYALDGAWVDVKVAIAARKCILDGCNE